MDPETNKKPEDWTNLLSFGGLAGAILGVLLLGAALSADPPSPRAGSPKSTAPIAERIPDQDPPPLTAEPRHAPRPALPAPRTSGLAERAAADLGRMATEPEGWTAQLAVMCDAKRVAGLTERFGEHEAFFLLPVLHGDEACFRICWNRYRTREAAAKAADLPRAMREIEPRPLPKAIAEVVE
jgi:hypothetical protein